ncbi:MAG TPA: TolC family protein [Chitinophaga sp.]|uniref:TolC family protein n=1 Tax=Chitinophaga sp. TaxID=1869181 RepID=UPI002DB6C41A|nr:TolC family protein [Chitinophaga sp.]HEU4551604.1 TolC family protein [Chitinophaga sp.]
MIIRTFFKYCILSAAGLLLYGATGNAQTLSLSLHDAVSLAIRHNRALKAAGIDVRIAQEQRKVARSLSLPSAGIGAQYAHYFDLPVFFGLGETDDKNKVPYSRFGGRDQFTAALSASYPVYNPAARPSQREAQLQEKASRSSYAAKEINISAAVKRTYLGILVLNERLKLQYESLQRNNKALQDARSLLAQGRALRVDTLRAYTTVKNLEPDMLRLNKAIEVGKLQLTTLIGIDTVQDVILTDSLLHPDAITIPGEAAVYETAKANRPDLQQLNLNRQIRGQGIALAKARRLPVVSLVGQYQLQTQAHRFDFFNASWPAASFAGAQVTVPLFSGSSNLAKIRQARLSYEQSGIQLTDAYEQLKTEVRQVVANLQETFERMQTQEQVKTTAAESYTIVQYRYQKGVTSRLELTDAELALTTAQLNYLEAVYDYLSARIELDRTTGKQ